MSATAFFYMANELISILENIIETGIPVPETLKDAVDILKRKSEINGGKGE
jgi:phage-related holin